MVIEFKRPGVTSETVTLMRDGNQIVALLGPDLQAGIGGCPVRAMEAWLAVLGADGGPLSAIRRLRRFETWRVRWYFENHRLPGIDF